MIDVQVLENAHAATAALHPLRNQLLAELAEPASAAALASRLDLPRQKVHYHLRELEKHGLVHEASTRKWGGLTERRYVSSAASYLLGNEALGAVAPEPARVEDRLSASYLVAIAARAVSEVGRLLRRAQETGKRLATLSIDTDLRFASARDRANFSRELTALVGELARKYHSEEAEAGRWHRLVITAYPGPAPSTPNAPNLETEN